MPEPPDITLIAALDRNRAIGRGGTMPWHLPDDLKRFKATTLGKPVLMGRRTALAVGRALPRRENLVLTRAWAAPFKGQTVVHSLDAATARVGDAALMVVGGGEVYALALPHARRLLLTEVDAVVSGADTWFPAFDPDDWSEVAREHHPADARHAFAFDFADYVRAGTPRSVAPLVREGPVPGPPRVRGGRTADGDIEVAAGVIVDAQGRVLLIQRLPGKHLAGLWEFPGGKLEAGETIDQALVRELDEELGIGVRAAEPLIVVPWQYPGKFVCLHALRVVDWRGEPQAREGNPMQWVPIADLDPCAMPPADVAIVAALRAAARAQPRQEG